MVSLFRARDEGSAWIRAATAAPSTSATLALCRGTDAVELACFCVLPPLTSPMELLPPISGMAGARREGSIDVGTSGGKDTPLVDFPSGVEIPDAKVTPLTGTGVDPRVDFAVVEAFCAHFRADFRVCRGVAGLTLCSEAGCIGWSLVPLNAGGILATLPAFSSGAFAWGLSTSPGPERTSGCL